MTDFWLGVEYGSVSGILITILLIVLVRKP